MKRFAWSLQRYLDVVRRREDALKASFASASAAVAQSRLAIRRRKQALARVLREIAAKPDSERLIGQEIVLACEPAERKAIEAMSAELEKREARRKELLTQLRDMRARREMLEKLREQALAEYRREVGAEELKLHDQTSQIAYVRRSASGPDRRSMTA